MKVLFITHKYPPSIGGMEKQSFELIEGMKKLTQVETIAYTANESKLKFFLSLKSRLRNLLEINKDISLIHLNDGLMAAWCSLWIKKITKLPIIVTFHGLDLVYPNLIYQKLIIPKLKQFDGFIPVSNQTKKELIKRGFDRAKIKTVLNGVSRRPQIKIDKQAITNLEERFDFKRESQNLLLAVGRPVKRKGFSWFVENVLAELDKNTVLFIAGSFDGRTSLKDRIMSILPEFLQRPIALFLGFPDDKFKLENLKAKYPNSLRLLPKLSEEELHLFYLISDLFVMPNIKVKGDMEGFGLVALEASSTGLTVLASELEGIQDAIQKSKNGYLIESQNSSEWINHIRYLMKNESTLQRASKHYSKYTIDNYSWMMMCANYLNFFKKIDSSKLLHLTVKETEQLFRKPA